MGGTSTDVCLIENLTRPRSTRPRSRAIPSRAAKWPSIPWARAAAAWRMSRPATRCRSVRAAPARSRARVLRTRRHRAHGHRRERGARAARHAAARTRDTSGPRARETSGRCARRKARRRERRGHGRRHRAHRGRADGQRDPRDLHRARLRSVRLRAARFRRRRPDACHADRGRNRHARDPDPHPPRQSLRAGTARLRSNLRARADFSRARSRRSIRRRSAPRWTSTCASDATSFVNADSRRRDALPARARHALCAPGVRAHGGSSRRRARSPPSCAGISSRPMRATTDARIRRARSRS